LIRRNRTKPMLKERAHVTCNVSFMQRSLLRVLFILPFWYRAR